MTVWQDPDAVTRDLRLDPLREQDLIGARTRWIRRHKLPAIGVPGSASVSVQREAPAAPEVKASSHRCFYACETQGPA